MLDDNLPEGNQAQNEPKPLNQPPRMTAPTPPSMASSMPSSAPSEPSTPLNETPPVGPSSMHETIDRSTMPSPTSSNLRGFWKLFADAWHSYWPHFWTFVKLNLLTVVIMLIPLLLTIAAVPLGIVGGGGLAIIGIILGVIVLAFVIISMLRIITANIVLACRIAAGKEKVGVFHLLKIAKHNVGKIIGVAILTGLAVMIGQILFVIPGLIFLTWFSLAAFVVIFEDLGVIKSMGRSYNLIKGYGWETFYLLAGITLLTGLLGLLVQLAGGAGLIFGLVFGAALGGGAAGTIAGIGTAVLVALIFAGLVSLFAPIWEIMPAMRYLDLKNIKDNNLPKTESTAKAVIISLILALIWVPLIAAGMWTSYKDLTGKKTKIQPSSDILKELPEITPMASHEIKARDARRKADLRILKAALDLYQRNNGAYPAAAGFPRPLSKMEDELTEEYIKPIPQDPLSGTDKPYLYVSQSGKVFALYATLENQNDPDIKTSGPTPDIPLPEGYNYWITSD